MRDARAEGAQKRRTRRNGNLAGRVTLTLALVIRFAIAILLNAFAFIIWDVGTRPPQRLFRDIASGVRNPSRLATGLTRFVIGALLLVLGSLVARPGLPTMHAYTVIETLMLIAALIVEQIIGEDLRVSARGRITSG